MMRFLLALLLLLPFAARADEAVITAEYGFAYETSAQQKNGAAYFTLHHMTRNNDRIIGVQSPIAERAELHVTETRPNEEMEMDVASMKKVEAIDVPYMSQLYFDPYGRHVMLMGLKQPLKVGEKFPLTLIFEKTGKVNTEILVVKNSNEMDVQSSEQWLPREDESEHDHEAEHGHEHEHDHHDHGTEEGHAH